MNITCGVPTLAGLKVVSTRCRTLGKLNGVTTKSSLADERYKRESDISFIKLT